MKKISMVLVAFLLTAFTTKKVEFNNVDNEKSTLKIENEISELQSIIGLKQYQAKLLEIKARGTANNNKVVKLLEQANLLKVNCLKYEAAVACLQRHLKQ